MARALHQLVSAEGGAVPGQNAQLRCPDGLHALSADDFATARPAGDAADGHRTAGACGGERTLW